MAIVTAANTSSPNTVKWATSTADPYELATQLRGVAENFDLHDHDSNKCLGVKRLQTTVAPTASGHVRVNTDTFQWWASSAAAVYTALSLEGTQTATGVKNFSSNLFVNDTSNSQMATGLTINQGGADNELLSGKSSDVAHGMTSQTETDTYWRSLKYSAANGGLIVDGFSAGTTGLAVRGWHTTDDTTKSAAGRGAVIIGGLLKSGTNATSLGANANILSVETNATTRFILDADGDSHQDVGTAWTNFDDQDDVALLDATAALLGRDPGGLRRSFSEGFLAENREKLAELRVVTFNADGHHFVNWSRFQMLHMGATRYLAERLASLERRLALKEG